ncbi:MAG: stage V sporulation T C-terminal domain-containing protein [Eubacteriales bacterium]
MKATGIVRRIDDLGRVVIPKEIRRTMRIREGDPLEIFTDREGEVIFKKYSPIGELASIAAQYAETLYKTCGVAAAVCDRDACIAVAGVPRRDYLDKALTPEADALMQNRSVYIRGEEDNPLSVVADAAEGVYVPVAAPIVTAGDVVGLVCAIASPETTESVDGDTVVKLITTAANFLGRQLED